MTDATPDSPLAHVHSHCRACGVQDPALPSTVVDYLLRLDGDDEFLEDVVSLERLVLAGLATATVSLTSEGQELAARVRTARAAQEPS